MKFYVLFNVNIAKFGRKTQSNISYDPLERKKKTREATIEMLEFIEKQDKEKFEKRLKRKGIDPETYEQERQQKNPHVAEEKKKFLERIRRGEDLSKEVVYDKTTGMQYLKFNEKKIPSLLTFDETQEEDSGKKHGKKTKKKGFHEATQLNINNCENLIPDMNPNLGMEENLSIDKGKEQEISPDEQIKELSSNQDNSNHPEQKKVKSQKKSLGDKLAKKKKDQEKSDKDEISTADLKNIEKEAKSLENNNKIDDIELKLAENISENESDILEATPKSIHEKAKHDEKLADDDDINFDLSKLKDAKHIDLNAKKITKKLSKEEKNQLIEKTSIGKFVLKIDENKIKNIEKSLEDQHNNEKLEQDKIERDKVKNEIKKVNNLNEAIKSMSKQDDNNRFYKLLEKFHPTILEKLVSQDGLIDQNPEKNIPKFLILFNYLRFNKIFSTYNRKDIFKIYEKILEHVKILTPLEVTSLVVNLDKMRINRPEYFRAIEVYIMENSPRFDIRSLANIVYSFARISLKQSIMSDFSPMYRHLETIIALKLKLVSSKDLCQIMIGYSKTQNFSQEFLQIMEKACIDSFDKFNTQELATICHSFGKNDYNSLGLFESTKKKLIHFPEKFKIMEIALLANVFEKYNLMDDQLYSLVQKQFIIKAEHVNVFDLSVLSDVLLNVKYTPQEQTKEKFLEISTILFHNIDANCLAKLTKNLTEKYNKGIVNNEFIEILWRKYDQLDKKQKIKGINKQNTLKELKEAKEAKLKNKSQVSM